jgi:hypothetical protein
MGVFDNVPNTTNARDFIGTNLDLEKQAKLRKQNEIEFAEDEKILNSSIFSTGVSHLQIFDGVGAVPTGLPPQKTCDIANCHPAVGMCTYAFDVTGGYGFQGIPFFTAIDYYVGGVIPGNSTAYAGPSISGSNPRNGTEINSFIDQATGRAIQNFTAMALYSEIKDGGYTFRNTDLEADLSFTTCAAYDSYTSAQTSVFGRYAVVSPAVIQVGDGATELDSSACGTLNAIMEMHQNQADCEGGSYVLGTGTFSGTDYLTWTTLT